MRSDTRIPHAPTSKHNRQNEYRTIVRFHHQFVAIKCGLNYDDNAKQHQLRAMAKRLHRMALSQWSTIIQQHDV